jgi:DNA mismatch repair protein MutS
VARLAGLPQSVLQRAGLVLEALEQGEREETGARKALIDDLPLFSAVASQVPQKPNILEDIISSVQPDTLSPKAALDLVYELKSHIKNS